MCALRTSPSTVSTEPVALPKRWAAVADLAAWMHAQPRVDQVIVIRTSDNSKGGFEAMFNAGVAMLPDDPDVQELAALGAQIVTDAGAEDRRRLGAYEIRRGSVPDGRGYALLGYALVLGRTLFVLYLETARCADIPGPTPDQTKNAFTEALIILLRHFRPAVCYTPLISRVFRHVDFATQLLRTLRSHRIRLVAAGEEVNLTGTEGQLNGQLRAWFAAQEADGVVDRLGDIEIGMYLAGSWYLGEDLLPFTWRAPSHTEVNHLTGEPVRVVDDRHRVEPVPEAAPVLAEFLRAARLRSRTRHELGMALGRAGITSRAPRHVRRNVRLDSCPHTQLAANAASSLLQERWLDAWQHGHYTRQIRLKHDPRKTMPALRDKVVDVNGDLFIEVTTPMPAPEGGWGVPDEVYDDVRERLRADAERSASGRGSRTGMQKPLNGLAEWISDASSWALTSIQHGSAYELRTRPVSQTSKDNKPLAWTTRDRWVATLDPATLHASVGSAMLTALAGLEEQTVPLTLHGPPSETPRERAEGELAAAKRALGVVQARLVGIQEDRQTLTGMKVLGTLSIDDEERLAELPAQEDQVRAERREADAHVKQLEQAVADAGSGSTEPAEQSGLADLGTVELLAAALTRTTYQAPDDLNRLLHRVLRDLRFTVVAHGTAVTWTATLLVPLVGDREATLTLTSPSPIPNVRRTSSRSRQPAETAQNPEALARLYLQDGLSMPRIGRLRGIRGDGAHDTALYRQITAVLTDLGVAPGLAHAALDMPATLRPQLFEALTVLEHQLDPWQAHLRAVYTAPGRFGDTWCLGHHGEARRAIGWLEANTNDPFTGAPAHDLQVGARLPYPLLIELSYRKLAKVDGVRRTRRGPLLRREWTTGEHGPIGVLECPNPHCPERARTGRGGVLVPMATPETTTTLGRPDEPLLGVVCRSCHQLPGRPDLFLPEQYLLPWVGGRRQKLTIDGTTAYVGAHLEAPLAR